MIVSSPASSQFTMNRKKDGDYSEKAMDSGFGVKNKRKIEKKGDKVNIAFFPEGGNAVVGLASRIGFKAWGEKGEDLQHNRRCL